MNEIKFKDAQAQLGVSDTTLQKWIEEGKILSRKALNRRVFVNVESLEKFIQERNKEFDRGLIDDAI